jgi:medium-chain acyl-[acyl-carrier-protein] hydrolase
MSTTSMQHSWILSPHPNPEAQWHLFCFPYTGGSASLFRPWAVAGLLSPGIEVHAIELPGRGTRQDEPPMTEFTELTDPLSDALLPFAKKDIVLFGHSLGGLMAFEVARQLQRRHNIIPLCLFASGCRAPHLPDTGPQITDVASLIAYIRSLGGQPNEQMIARRWPLFAADIVLRTSYRYAEDVPLPCPIVACGGKQDTSVSENDLAAWRVHTLKECSVHMFPGNHFFLHSSLQQLLEVVKHYTTTSQTPFEGDSIYV